MEQKRDVKLISKKAWGNRKGALKKKLIDTSGETTINNVSSENIHSDIIVNDYVPPNSSQTFE